jgi:DNA invertase Pin-like site-specific DNA recombinase
MTTGKFVAYYRVSTDKQGQSGLGLDAQRQAVEAYLNGGDWALVEEFVEIESGKRNDRKQLDLALAACKREKATLVVAKLDRLARNVHFITGLQEARIKFVAVDNPHADEVMVQLFAVFAQYEGKQISQRTKAALAAAKARGVVLGKHGKVLARQNAAQADERALQIAPTVHKLRRGRSVRELVAEMNKRGVQTAKGGQWHVSSVHRLLKRLDGIEQQERAA